jgi:hypothetical protein
MCLDFEEQKRRRVACRACTGTSMPFECGVGFGNRREEQILFTPVFDEQASLKRCLMCPCWSRDVFQRGAGLRQARKNMQLIGVSFGEQKDGKETYNIYTVVSMSFQHGFLDYPGHAKKTWQFCIPILKQGKEIRSWFRKEAGERFHFLEVWCHTNVLFRLWGRQPSMRLRHIIFEAARANINRMLANFEEGDTCITTARSSIS